jgi:hypothetical protein
MITPVLSRTGYGAIKTNHYLGLSPHVFATLDMSVYVFS